MLKTTSSIDNGGGETIGSTGWEAYENATWDEGISGWGCCSEREENALVEVLVRIRRGTFKSRVVEKERVDSLWE